MMQPAECGPFSYFFITNSNMYLCFFRADKMAEFFYNIEFQLNSFYPLIKKITVI